MKRLIAAILVFTVASASALAATDHEKPNVRAITTLATLH